MAFTLDGYPLTRLPGRGGYSGYAPQRDRAEEGTLSGVAIFDWGVVTEDLTLVLTAPIVPRCEFDAIQLRYRDSEADGSPKTYTFVAPEDTYEVKIASLTGHKQRVDGIRDLWADVRLVLRVISFP